jgi:hypothetical protein
MRRLGPGSIAIVAAVAGALIVGCSTYAERVARRWPATQPAAPRSELELLVSMALHEWTKDRGTGPVIVSNAVGRSGSVVLTPGAIPSSPRRFILLAPEEIRLGAQKVGSITYLYVGYVEVLDDMAYVMVNVASTRRWQHGPGATRSLVGYELRFEKTEGEWLFRGISGGWITGMPASAGPHA